MGGCLGGCGMDGCLGGFGGCLGGDGGCWVGMAGVERALGGWLGVWVVRTCSRGALLIHDLLRFVLHLDLDTLVS